MQLPGTQWTIDTPYHWGIILFTFMGALIGWGVGVAVRLILNGK
jgi:hypothetical protein